MHLSPGVRVRLRVSYKNAQTEPKMVVCALIKKLPHTIVVASNQSKLLKDSGLSLSDSHAEYRQDRRDCTESHNYLEH